MNTDVCLSSVFFVGHKKDFEKLESMKYKNHLAHAKPKWDEKICV